MPDRVEDGRQLMNAATAVQQAAKVAAQRHLSPSARALTDRLKTYDDNFLEACRTIIRDDAVSHFRTEQSQRTGEEAV